MSASQIAFHLQTLSIPTTAKRLVSLWFGDVDRIQLMSGTAFTGSATLCAVYALSGRMQYYLVFLSLANRPAEIWRCGPEEIKSSEACAFEIEILAHLRHQGIVLAPTLQSSPSYRQILKNLPFSFGHDDNTHPAGLFDPPGAPQEKRLSASDKNDLKALLTFF
ncbi:MAG: hypothetical protein FWC40_08640 [Proteobacteria bacterium]|nr:hypothetical protein [Pseudomonadota bacterium]